MITSEIATPCPLTRRVFEEEEGGAKKKTLLGLMFGTARAEAEDAADWKKT